MKLSRKTKNLAQSECKRLCNELDGIIAVVIASQDGFDVASQVSKNLDSVRISAMASSINAIGSVVSAEADIGISESITVKTENGFAYIISVNMDEEAYILNLIANDSAILAQIIYQCQETKSKLDAH
ncbi:MAG: roadblock/LC7 domain-containing protein [Cellvibrionaceae bacterium]